MAQGVEMSGKAFETPLRQRKPGLKADYRGFGPEPVALAAFRHRPPAKQRPTKRTAKANANKRAQRMEWILITNVVLAILIALVP